MKRLLGVLGLLTLAACGGGGDDNNSQPPGGGAGGTPGGAGGTPPGPDPSSVCGESKVGVPRLRRLSREEMLRTLEDVFPEAKSAWSIKLSADPISKHGFDNDATILVVSNQTAGELDQAGKVAGDAVSGAALATMLPCSSSAPDAACAGQFLDKYGKRLFRRALTAEERTKYLGLFTQASTAKGFPAGIAWLTRALVQSPHAVYRREIGVPQNGTYQLSPAEIATQLAYDYTGTLPTEALLAKAEAGQLATPEALEATARELLMTDAGLRTVERFFDAWLHYGRTASVTKANVQNFETLRDEMVAETRRFIGEIVVGQNGGLNQLLTASFTTPTANLASFYGFAAPASPYAVTQRPAGRGIGILAQGAVLAAQSGPKASSPTKRGVLVMDRVLCRVVPPVPPTVPKLGDPMPGQFTTRQHYEEIHLMDAACKGCHVRFDPIGFGFEHFDEAGRYREQDGGLPINAVSYVPAENPTDRLFEFASQEELAQGLAAQKLPYECVTGLVSTYVNGVADACLGETKRGAFIDSQVGFVDYLASLAAEPHFRQRRAP
jgi:Protein of unknown function (DUF1592)/Protein of unknown function (DUF1588)/Protein of unknown function (DUF1595)/Protein of unknown function (DUF1587)